MAPPFVSQTVDNVRLVPAINISTDLGEVVKIILAHPDEFLGKDIGLGDRWSTPREMAESVEKITGVKTRAVEDLEFLKDAPVSASRLHLDKRRADRTNRASTI